MNLNDSQKSQIANWVNSGASLSEIQTKISEEFGISMTYMDVRFLVDDLDLELQEKGTNTVPAEAHEAQSVPAGVAHYPQQQAGQTPRGANPEAFADEDEVPAGTPASEAAAAELNKVAVSVDAVQAPGILVGGSVRFTDGVRAKWFIDRNGQLGIDGLPEGYRPSREDAMQFQVALKAELSRLGYQ